jgi:hypothetical protein
LVGGRQKRKWPDEKSEDQEYEMNLDMDAFIAQYADAYRGYSLTDLYREQDRIILIIQRLRIQPVMPDAMIYMLERKLEALEFLVEQKYENRQYSS